MYNPLSNPHRFIRTAISFALILIFCLLNPLSGFAANAADSVVRLVIQFAPGDTIIREVRFSTPSITGLQALQMTDLEIVTMDSGYGPYVCSINGFGSCTDFSKYWDYQYLDGNAWEEYPVGANGSTLVDGAVEGWMFHAYGDGDALPDYTNLESAIDALNWLRTQQNGATGGFAAVSDTLLALGSNRENPSLWRLAQGNPSFNDYLIANQVSIASNSAASSGKLASGLRAAANTCWWPTAKKPSAYYISATGAYETGNYGAGHQTWAILGEVAFGNSVPALAVTYLKGLVKPNGGWEWDAGFGTDSNTTAMAIQALLATGEPVSSDYIQNGLDYLKTLQNDDGGFYYAPFNNLPADSETNSTAYVVMAVRASGQDPATWTKGGHDPIEYLLSQQLPNGSFQYQSATPGANLFSTVQVISALLGKYYPLPGSDLSQCPTVYMPVLFR